MVSDNFLSNINIENVLQLCVFFILFAGRILNGEYFCQYSLDIWLFLVPKKNQELRREILRTKDQRFDKSSAPIL
jgi:hypothetical protein